MSPIEVTDKWVLFRFNRIHNTVQWFVIAKPYMVFWYYNGIHYANFLYLQVTFMFLHEAHCVTLYWHACGRPKQQLNGKTSQCIVKS